MIHPIVHLELSANDPAAAAKFYADVFGWKIEHDERFDYYQFTAEGGPGGGFVKVGEQTTAGAVVPYLGVQDIDAALQTAVANGGALVIPKTEIPGVGWFGQFTDPAGNRIGVYTSMHPQS